MNPFKKHPAIKEEQAVRQYAYSVYDEKAKAYNIPFFYPQNDLAIRAIKDSLRNPNSVISRHPEDFAVYVIGTYNDLDGKLESFAQPELLARVSEIANEIIKIMEVPSHETK